MNPNLNKPIFAVLFDADSQTWRCFQQPVDVYSVTETADVLPVLRDIEARVNAQRLTAVGFVSYEAAPGFDNALVTRAPENLPLLQFGLFEADEIVDAPVPPAGVRTLAWQPSISEAEYHNTIAAIHDYIRRGQTYQVNYTFRLHSKLQQPAFEFFASVQKAQQALYAAFLQTEQLSICSASPELFFRLDGSTLVSKPMKGTARRGLTWEADKKQRHSLYNSEKDRAENVMIVDMVRNDMGRIAQIGSVNVDALYGIERYPTVFQMVSTVSCRTVANVAGIFEALFPAASITGAPRARTMQIIAELETSPRGVYTGAIGYMAPDRQAQFNVAIRTACVENEQMTYGVGGGIVWDSRPDTEFQECRAKAAVLSHVLPDFALLETMLWEPEHVVFLEALHFQRLTRSADYFSFPVEIARLRSALNERCSQLAQQPHKIRLLVYPDHFDIQPVPLTAGKEVLKTCPTARAVQSSDVFLYHKTTHRQVYNEALRAHPEMDDVLLFNENGRVTEFCFGNLVYEEDGQLYTPPVADGLLAGTFRGFLLATNVIREKRLAMKMLDASMNLYRINSVQKWQRVELKIDLG